MRTIGWHLGSGLLLIGLALAGCGGAGKSGANCTPGDLRCPCYANNTCNGNLSCVSKVCVDPNGARPDSAVGSGGQIGHDAASGSDGSCAVGMVRCPCYANQTCNNSLQCISQICVEPAAADGSMGGEAGTARPDAAAAGGAAPDAASSTGGTGGGGSGGAEDAGPGRPTQTPRPAVRAAPVGPAVRVGLVEPAVRVDVRMPA